MPPHTHPSAVPQPYIGDEPFVFVSYARKDSELAYAEIARLQALGCRVWYDRAIRGAKKWREELRSAIENCHLFVALLTANAATSEYMEKEIYHARDHRKEFLALHFAPGALSKDVAFEVKHLQHIHCHELPEVELADQLRACIPAEVIADRDTRELAARVGGALAGAPAACVRAEYLRHLPEGWVPVVPCADAARALCTCTADLLRAARSPEGVPPALALLAGAVALVPEPARAALTAAVRARAAEDGAPDPCAVAPAPAPEPTSAEGEAYLTIVVKRPHAPGPHSVSARVRGPNIDRCLAATTAATVDELEHQLVDLRAAAERQLCAYDTSLKLNVEVYLPCELLGLHIEAIRVDVPGFGTTPFGAENTVVLRSTGRYFDSSAPLSASMNTFRNRGAGLRDRPPMAVTDMGSAPPAAPTLAYRVGTSAPVVVRNHLRNCKEPQLACLILGGPPDEHLFREVLKAGVPMLAWPRGPAAEDAVLQTVAPRDLPERLRQLRFEDAQAGLPAGQLALLWDDPERPPPEIELLRDT